MHPKKIRLEMECYFIHMAAKPGLPIIYCIKSIFVDFFVCIGTSFLSNGITNVFWPASVYLPLACWHKIFL